MDQHIEVWQPIIRCGPVKLQCPDCTSQPVVLTDGTTKRLAWHGFNSVFGAPYCPASGTRVS